MKWDEWRGDFDGRRVMFTKHLLALRGRRADLHKMVDVDSFGCLHTHPATAIRVVLWGGYIEEVEGKGMRVVHAFSVSVVRPEHCHRIAALVNGRSSYTLWLRGRKTADVELRGPGWPEEYRSKE